MIITTISTSNFMFHFQTFQTPCCPFYSLVRLELVSLLSPPMRLNATIKRDYNASWMIEILMSQLYESVFT